MSKNTDDKFMAFLAGIIAGLILCFIIVIIIDCKHGIEIRKDAKVYIAGHKYRVTSIDDSNSLGIDVSTCTVFLNVNKL